MRNHLKTRSSLIALTGAAVAATATPAFAQNEGVEAADDENVIVVSGIRGQNEDIIETKREIVGVSDSLSAGDIGKLPDFNIADAIRRIAGINTIFDEDEGQFVAARGLSADFTHTEFDGGSVAAVDLGGFFGDGRRVLLESVPAGAVSSVNVYKTEQARLDGQGIGAQVNLVTRSAFDSLGTFFTATGALGFFTDQNAPEVSKIGHADENRQDEPSYRTEFAFSTRFGSSDDFGVVLAGFNNYKKRDQERLIPGIVPRFYDSSTAALTTIDDPDAVHLGGVAVRAGYSNEVRRWGLLGKLEYQGASGTTAAISGIYSQQDESERTDQGTLITFAPPSSINGGILNFASLPMNLRSQLWDAKKHLLHINGKVEQEWDDSNTTRFQAVYSDAGYAEVKPRAEIRSLQTGPVSIGTNLTTSFTNGADFFLDPVNATGANLNASNLDLTDDNSELFEISFSHSFNTGAGADGFGFDLGGRYRKIDRLYDRLFYDLDGTASANADVGNFLIPGVGYTPRRSNVPYPIIDITAFDFNAAAAGSDGNLELVSVSDALTPGNGSFAVDEKVFALFGQAQHRGDRHLIQSGIRWEQTDSSATALDITGMTPQLVTRDGSYDNFLPSITMQYELSDQLIIKAAASRSLARPGHAALSGAISTTVDNNGVTTTTQGNPNLRPRISDNLDLSLEYYFDDGDGLASVAVFHKNIEDEIFGRTTLLSDGSRIIRPENADSANVTGVEFNLIKNRFDFLPGFLSNLGFSSNFSYFWGEINISDTEKLDFLVEQPEYIFNATLFYADGPFEGRLTYNLTDSYLEFGQPTNDFGWRSATRNFLDAQVQYKINDNFEVFGEVRNLLNEPEESYFGPGERFLADSSTFGRAFWIGVTFTN